jgi:ABC-type transport system involved in Fe-S cluster assembly fused permease/ATPase subunit
VTDALLNWETVKYFTNESLEQEKYGEAIDGYQVRT